MSLEQQPGGRLRVRWIDATGKHRSKTFTPKVEPNARKLRQMAESFERQKIREVAMGVPEPTDPKMTLSDVVDEFVPVVIDQKAPKTQALYRSLWNVHIQPAFGNYPLSHITPGQIETWLSLFKGKEVTRQKSLVLLGQMFRFAQKRQWCVANPVELVDKPKAPAGDPIYCPPPLEVEKIREAFLEGDKPLEATLASVIAYAGLRPLGEALSLTRGDVRNRTLLIRDQKRGRIRSVDILPPLAEDLKWWMGQQLAFDNAPLFPSHDGNFWATSTYDSWRKWTWHKVTDINPRDLRHTFVSLLIRDESYSRREIADQAGHSLEVQDRVYSHVFAELRGTGSADGAIRGAREKVFGSGGLREVV